MAQAGNTGFATTLYGDDSERARLSAESIKTDLAAIGIDVDIVLNDFGTFLGIVSKPHAAPMALGGWSQDFPDPSDFLDPLFTCSTAVEGGQNLRRTVTRRSMPASPRPAASWTSRRRSRNPGHPGHHHGRGAHRARPGAHPGRGHLRSGHRLRPLPSGLGLGLRDHRLE